MTEETLVLPPVLSFEEWGKKFEKEDQKWLLDVRKISHVVDCPQLSRVTVVHIPLDSLRERSSELPTRQRSFSVLVEDMSCIEQVQLILLHSDRPRRQPWNVAAIIDASRTHLAHPDECILCKAVQSIPTTHTTSFVPLPRLWEPDSMVQNIMLPLVKDFLASTKNQKKKYEIWDLGAGAGRDVCFLAEQLKRDTKHFAVVAMDQRYRGEQERTAFHDFTQRRKVEDVTQCRNVQLEQPLHLEQATICCLYAVRFWNRSLFQHEILDRADEVLCNGTLVAISHFGKPYQGAAWTFPHPKEKHVLERNELRTLFEEATYSTSSRWKICHDQVVPDSDHGRTLIQFVAQFQKEANTEQ
jgi:hypothetical protein